MAVIGDAPDSINVAPYYNARGVTRGNVVQVRNPDDQDALLHELGHFWSIKAQQNGTSQELADSLRFDPYSESGAERLADVYADALRQKTGRLHTPSHDVEILLRMLERTQTPPRRP